MGWVAGALVLVGVLARLLGPGHDSLWGDEALCLLNALAPPEATIQVLAAQNQPPGYHLLLRGWLDVAGLDAAMGARLLSGLSGVLALVLLMLLTRMLLGSLEAALAGILGATSVFWIIFSREATMYAPTLALGLGCTTLLVHLLRWPGPLHQQASGWVCLGVLRATLFFTHYFGLFLMMGEAAVVLWRCLRLRRPALLLAWLGSLCITLAIVAPWIPTFLEQRARVAATFWTRDFSPLMIVNLFRQWALFVPELRHTPWIALVAGPLMTVGVACVGLLMLCRRPAAVAGDANASCPPDIISPVLLLGVPLLVCLAQSLASRSLFEPKYLIVFSGFFYLLVAAGLAQVARVGGRRAGAAMMVLALAAWVAANAAALGLYLTHPGYRHPDLRGAVSHIEAHWQPGDVVVTLDSEGLATFHYYLRHAPARPLFMYAPDGPPPFFEGLGMMPRAMFIDDFDLVLAGQKRLWLLITSRDERPWAPWPDVDARQRELLDFLAGRLNLAAIPEPLALRRLRLYLFEIQIPFDPDMAWKAWDEWMHRVADWRRAAPLQQHHAPAQP